MMVLRSSSFRFFLLFYGQGGKCSGAGFPVAIALHLYLFNRVFCVNLVRFYLAGWQVIFLKPEDSFAQAIQIVSSGRVHRSYILNQDGEPAGVVTLTDIIRTVMKELAGEEQ